MRYAGFTVLGLGLIAAACTVIAYVSYVIAQIGICAGGPQPFEIQRECPDGTTATILALFGAFPGPRPGSAAALPAGAGSRL